jgi:hypothetical protein
VSTDIDLGPLCIQGHAMPDGAECCPVCGMTVDESAIEPEPELPAEAMSNDTAALLTDSPPEPDAAPSPHRRDRRFWVASFLVIVLLLSLAGAVWFFVFRTTDEDRYLSDLSKAHLLADFGSSEAAVAQGHAFCSKLSAGAPPSGYKSQQIAVANFCHDFGSAFSVVPTPQEQQQHLTTALRDGGMGGRFASDAAAVAYAESVCRSLDGGGPQQGPQEDAVAVSIYCSKYESGFKTLHPIQVDGSFKLNDSDPSTYIPSIMGSDSSCEGAGGYSDISSGAEVVVKNSSGTVLTTTQLGDGTGYPPVQCTFKFSFTVMDGDEGGYSVTVSHRGELHYTAAQLKIPDEVAITLGS